MSYRLLDGRLVEDANDEKLTKRFGSTYTFFKKQHPSLHKLPENEVSDICYTFNKSPYGDTPEKAVARTNDYIKSQMPRWEKEYFNPIPATPKPMSASANVSANANTAASWGNFGTPNKNNMFTTSSGKSLKQNTWETLGGAKADTFGSFTPMKMPKPAPEPKVPQMTPMPQMPQMQTPTPWASGQKRMSQNVLANLPQPMPQQIIQQRMGDYNQKHSLLPFPNGYNNLTMQDYLEFVNNSMAPYKNTPIGRGIQSLNANDYLDVLNQSRLGAEYVLNGALLDNYSFVNNLLGGNYEERSNQLQKQADDAQIGELHRFTKKNLEALGRYATQEAYKNLLQKFWKLLF